MSRTTNLNQFMDNFLELERRIELGYIPKDKAFKVDKFGRVNLINNTLSLVASFNNLDPFLTTPTELYIASNSASDVFSVVIDYINQDRDLAQMEVTLNGLTPVSLGSDIYCIDKIYNSSYVNQIGTKVVVTSNITGIPLSESEIYSEMIFTSGVASNNSLSGVYSVPRNYSAFITKASITADKNSDVKGAFFIRQDGGVFRYVRALQTFQQQSRDNVIFDKAIEKTDFKPICIAQTGGIAFIDYTFICIHNDYLNEFI